MEKEIARIADEIAELVGEGVEREEIKEALKKYVQLGIDLPSARQVLLKKYGVKGIRGTGDEVELADLSGGEMSVNLLVKIISLSKKVVRLSGGEEKEITFGLMADRSGIRKFTAWEDYGLEVGGTYRVEGAYTKSYRGEVEVNLGTLCTVEPAPGELEDLDITSLPRIGSAREVKIGEIIPRMGTVTVEGKVLTASEKTVTVSGTEKEIQEGVLGDETGVIRFTAWGDVRLDEGKSYRITGAYVRSWKGIPQLGIDERAEITELESDVEVKSSTEGPVRKRISELLLKGEQNVEVVGCLIEVREGSGLLFRCPVCRRVLRDSTCRVHGPQQGYPDLRVKAVIDDGYGAAQVVLNREITESLIGMSPEQALEESEGRGEVLWLEEEIKRKLQGRWFVMRGTAILDDFGPTILPKEVVAVEGDVEEELRELLKEIEEVGP